MAGKILIAKPGLDGHDRGARMVVRSLRDAGFEVDYTGIRRTPEEIAVHAEEFGAELVGLSILSGAHMELVPRVMDALANRGMDTVPVALGGIIPEHDRAALLEMGVVAIFGPGARTEDIRAAIEAAIAAYQRGQA
ncbi:MAG: cobalamin B12-binding domain-containing protein [Chloroflexi bacterium]|nr:cobalamin B12-binding domain-containing protein [Chloroflexota bacterium]MDA1172915.1 cobalamin B12-binding domain-containing protein [Chloroflexota bacterium]